VKLTELFRAAVVEYLLVSRVEPNAPHHVADLRAVNQAVSTIPEVEQIEHFLDVCAHSIHTITKDMDICRDE